MMATTTDNESIPGFEPRSDDDDDNDNNNSSSEETNTESIDPSAYSASVETSGLSTENRGREADDGNGNKGGNPFEAALKWFRGVQGMGTIVTALFIIGEMAGGGIVSMPQAVMRTSWAGVSLIIAGGIMSAYTGNQLGECWTILQRTWPEYREEHTRKPYPAIAFRAGGRWAQFGHTFFIPTHAVSFCIDTTLFGVSTVFLLLASENLQSLIKTWYGNDISFCLFLLIVAVCLLPVTFLGSPKDFWISMVLAMTATSVAVILMFVAFGEDTAMIKRQHTVIVHQSGIHFREFCLAFGTILFAFGGHAAFPTIQHDMREPHKFGQSVTIAYSIIILCFYLPIGIGGWLVYGNLLGSNVLTVLGYDPYTNEYNRMNQAATVLITIHVILSFVIVINPLNQEIEELVRIPKKFTWKRVICRTLVMAVVLFVAETIPHFGYVLNLIGGSTIAALTFVFPPIFAPLLMQKMKPFDTETNVVKRFFSGHWHHSMLNVIIIAVGIIGGIASTYSAIYDISQKSSSGGGNVFTRPCYAQ